MFLSDRDLEFAHSLADLIIDPAPAEFGPSGVDLHLDHIKEARVWDAEKYDASLKDQASSNPAISLDNFDYKRFASQFAIPVPLFNRSGENPLVYRQDDGVILCPNGFFLWQTREVVGTPTAKARYICFINGKSTRARLGVVVHLTAPTIDAGWWGHVTLEIANLGPFKIALAEGDAIAQIVVAMVSSPPEEKKRVRGVDVGQAAVDATSAQGRRKKK